MRMRSQLREEEICSGNVGERGACRRCDGDEGADGDLVRGGVKMDVQVEGGEGDGLALGVFGGRVRRPVWWRADSAAGPAWVVVWPFSSVEREKMTLPVALGGCGLGGVVAELRGRGAADGAVDWAMRGETARPEARKANASARAREKLHEPRPFCFFGLDAAAWRGAGHALAVASAAPGVAALAGGFVEHDGSGGGDVEGADAAGHGDAQQVVAGAADEIVEACAFAAEDEDAVAGEVELVVVGGAAFVEADDPEILALELFEGADEVDDAGDAEVLGCAGAGLYGHGAEGRGAALGEDDAVDAGAVGYAEESAEILRVFDAVEGEEEAGCVGLQWIGGEEVFDGEEFLGADEGDYA